MRIQRRKRAHAAVETGALSDILFFLLIFFLMVASLSAANMMKLQLPKSDSEEKAKKKEIIHVYLSEDGKYFIEKRQVANLEDELKALKKEGAEQSVMIGIEKDRPVQELVDMVDMVHRVKMKPLLATAK